LLAVLLFIFANDCHKQTRLQFSTTDQTQTQPQHSARCHSVRSFCTQLMASLAALDVTMSERMCDACSDAAGR
jgi:hypothetical protein